MSTPDYSMITDPSRPRPVRWSAFIGALLTSVLAVLTATETLAPVVAGSLLGVVTLVSLGGWLFVEEKVTPVADPAEKLPNGTLVKLTPDAASPPSSPPSRPKDPDVGGFGIA